LYLADQKQSTSIKVIEVTWCPACLSSW